MVSKLKEMEIEKYINTEYKKMDNRGKKHKLEKTAKAIEYSNVILLMGVLFIVLGLRINELLPYLMCLLCGIVFFMLGLKYFGVAHETLKQEIKNL